MASLQNNDIFTPPGGSINERGQIQVNDTFQVTGHDNVFAIGDCAAIGDPLMAASAGYQADHIVKNLKKYVNGQAMAPYKAGMLILTD